MQAWQQRVIAEEAALAGKCNDLKDFIDRHPDFMKLHVVEKSLLIEQYTCMVKYRTILQTRISRFII